MIVLVTGATSGFGRAIAKLLIDKGHQVIGTGRRQEKLVELQNELGDKFLPLCFDVANLQQSKQALANLPKNFQQIDVLVNNAGGALGLEPAHQADLADWQQMIDTNVTGLVQMTRLVLPKMVEKNRGLIVNIGSIAGTYPYPGGNVYGATKAFVKQFSLNLRADLAGTRIRVSNVEPGLSGGTEFSQVRFKGDNERVKQLYDNVDFVTAEDIANIVAWIIEQPEHVNINSLEVMPVAQSFSPLAVARGI